MTELKKNYYPPMHTAEHILNRTMVVFFDCKRAENCHIERKKSKCDFLLKQNPDNQKIVEVEKKVNQIIKKNLNVFHKFIEYDEAVKKYKLKINKKDNPKVRITYIGDYDSCPCIGEHVKNTSEIGKFKITTTTFKDGVLRIRFKLF